ncbi:PepSY domain-containing protein [Qipengyuania sp. DGS5-3]|uniref:PepSY domain-containing protein n=1 Tax=Qipengyuania sp. DGS5-3 TaxID=3349632 RepID=UPI0036D2B461
MKRGFTQLLAAVLVAALVQSGFVAAPTAAQSREDQSKARQEMRAGNIMRAREIEARVLPTMGNAEYLGFAYDSTALAYRLKFIRSGKVMFVDVDARTGRVLKRSR